MFGASAAPAYGGAPESSFVNIVKQDAQQKGGTNFHAQSIGFLCMPPFLAFAFMDLTFAFLSGNYMPVALVFAAGCISFAFLLLAVSRGSVSGPAYTFASVLVFIAIATGIMSGLSIQAKFYQPYWNYEHRPIYTDVLATDPAAARADAGIIGFANNAIVDTFRMGNLRDQKGNSFCVAPILDESQQTQAEFWAVGMDCCEGRIGFYCDDVMDTSAKTGAVVFESQIAYGEFQRAVKQASARHGLQIPKNPVLLRWVKDQATVTDSLWRDGTIHLVTGISFYGLASLLVGVALHASTGNFRK